MNGPVILNNARELLAHEIFRYREPKPSPLKISPWLAMSLLQKAIRRGERICHSAWGLTLDRRPSRTPVHAQHRIVSTN
jgi:hypothetical protein